MVNVFIAHLIGDFILQNDWMAGKKKNSSLACFIHVFIYLFPFLLCSLEWWQILLIGMQHFLQDRTGFVFWWMKEWKHVPIDYWNELPLYVDQSFHLVWIQIVVILGPIFG